MKKIQIVLFLLCFIFSFEDCQNCNTENGICIENAICECKEQYSTYPYDAKVQCSYKKCQKFENVFL